MAGGGHGEFGPGGGVARPRAMAGFGMSYDMLRKVGDYGTNEAPQLLTNSPNMEQNWGVGKELHLQVVMNGGGSGRESVG